MQNQWHNKEKKIEYLKRYTRERPEGMLFIYGPKSSEKQPYLISLYHCLCAVVLTTVNLCEL